MKKNSLFVLYLAIVFLILMIPSTGMFFWRTDATAEKKELSKLPQLINKNQINANYFPELGTYFEDHFALKEYFVTANAEIRGSLFGSGVEDRVIVGKDGWLYFNGTLDDYLGKEKMNDRELFMAAKNLKLVQEYCEKNGSEFLFVVPLNKNRLYDKAMPVRYKKDEESNYSNLQLFLDDLGVHYTDFTQSFMSHQHTLYFKRDTHWTTEGALTAYKDIMNYFSLKHETYLNIPHSEVTDHIGDIDEMRYPKKIVTEPDYAYDYHYNYVGEVKDNMDPWIETKNPLKENRLLMYRDSFGELLLPFLAEEYNEGYFSRYVPYNIWQVDQYQPTHVIIERAERTLRKLITDIPAMNGLEKSLVLGPKIATSSTIKIKKEQDYYSISGYVDNKYVEDNTEFFLTIKDENNKVISYETFYLSGKNQRRNCYQINLLDSQIPEGKIQILLTIATDEQNMIVASQEFKKKDN